MVGTAEALLYDALSDGALASGHDSCLSLGDSYDVFVDNTGFTNAKRDVMMPCIDDYSTCVNTAVFILSFGMVRLLPLFDDGNCLLLSIQVFALAFLAKPCQRGLRWQ